MKGAAKIVLIDQDNRYLMLYRNQHPVLGDDPDIPGGVVEPDESFLEAVIRETREEIGLAIEGRDIREVYRGTDYSEYGMEQALFVVEFDERPIVRISWEHGGFEWLSQREFLNRARDANDTFMHMVHAVMDDGN